ncbi:MAG: alpha/beta fold hydrolase [Steroidobacteraceae bacterium]
MAAAGIPIVFIHGLWLNGLESFFLRERVRSAGFAPSVFRYPSLHTSLAEVTAALAERLRSFGDTVHIVAHSLGGLIALATLERERDLPPGRVVLLGSPVQGSRAASAIASWSFGPQVLGPLAFAELARTRNCRWQLPREIGLIAGSRSAGLGRVFATLPQPNDGTVCVDETRLPGATAHLVLDVSHTGMLLNQSVAEATNRFLERGSFETSKSGLHV